MIKVDASEIMALGRDFEQLSATILEKNLRIGANIAGAEIQSEARSIVAVDTGALRLSIENSIFPTHEGLMIEVGPTQPYGKEIEYGRPPGTKVSPLALKKWAEKRGLNPYAVARSIERKGSPAQPFMIPAERRTGDSVVSILTQAVVNAFKQAFNS